MINRKLKKFLSYYKPYLRLFAADMVCALGAAAISLIYPLIVRYITNDILPNYEISEAVGIIAKLALVMIGLALLELFCNYFILFILTVQTRIWICSYSAYIHSHKKSPSYTFPLVVLKLARSKELSYAPTPFL